MNIISSRERLDALIAEQRNRKPLYTPNIKIQKQRKIPRKQAIDEARIDAFNSALSVLRDKLRVEKSERMRIGMYSAISEIERMRDGVEK